MKGDKLFRDAKIGSVLRISNSTGEVKLNNFLAIVTYVEVHGDELVISYKNSCFQHTITVHKEATYKTIYIRERKWSNCRTEMPYWYERIYDKFFDDFINKKNSSIRKYKATCNFKFKYDICLT